MLRRSVRVISDYIIYSFKATKVVETGGTKRTFHSKRKINKTIPEKFSYIFSKKIKKPPYSRIDADQAVTLML